MTISVAGSLAGPGTTWVGILRKPARAIGAHRGDAACRALRKPRVADRRRRDRVDPNVAGPLNPQTVAAGEESSGSPTGGIS